MPRPSVKQDFDALLKATEENRAERKKAQQKMENLEATIQALQVDKLKSERKRGKTR